MTHEQLSTLKLLTTGISLKYQQHKKQQQQNSSRKNSSFQTRDYLPV